jgi:hypothetical protein
MQTEVGKRNPAGIFIKHHAAPLWNPVVLAVNAKTVQVFVAPVESDLESVMEFGEARFAGDQQAAPDQRTHAAEHDPKLIDLR